MVFSLEKEGMTNNYLKKNKILQVKIIKLMLKMISCNTMIVTKILFLRMLQISLIILHVIKFFLTSISRVLLKRITTCKLKTIKKVQGFKDKLRKYLKNNNSIKLVPIFKIQIIPLLSHPPRTTVTLQLLENIKVALLFIQMGYLAQRVDL